MVAVAPTGVPQPNIGAINAFTPGGGVGVTLSAPIVQAANAGTPGVAVVMRPQDQPVVSLMRPESNDGVWISFKGEKWISAGAAVVYSDSEFARAGEYSGFPVYTRQGVQEEMIYLPTRAGLVAPYRLKR
jgi:hypothetical protein